MISVFYIDENRSAEGQTDVFKWAVWTKVNRSLDRSLALMINIILSDEDAPMEIWHVSADSCSHDVWASARPVVQTDAEEAACLGNNIWLQLK